MPRPKISRPEVFLPRTSFPRVRVRRTSTITYTAATTDNILVWQSALSDTGGMWSASDPTKILFRLTGEVEIEYALQLSQDPIQTVLRLNGDSTLNLDYTVTKPVSRGPIRVSVRSGDYVQILIDAHATNDTTVNVNGAADPRMIVSYATRGQ